MGFSKWEASQLQEYDPVMCSETDSGTDLVLCRIQQVYPDLEAAYIQFESGNTKYVRFDELEMSEELEKRFGNVTKPEPEPERSSVFHKDDFHLNKGAIVTLQDTDQRYTVVLENPQKPLQPGQVRVRPLFGRKNRKKKEFNANIVD